MDADDLARLDETPVAALRPGGRRVSRAPEEEAVDGTGEPRGEPIEHVGHRVAGSVHAAGSAGADGAGVVEEPAGDTLDVGDDGTELVEVVTGRLEAAGGTSELLGDGSEDVDGVEDGTELVGATVELVEDVVDVVVLLVDVVVVVVVGSGRVHGPVPVLMAVLPFAHTADTVNDVPEYGTSTVWRGPSVPA